MMLEKPDPEMYIHPLQLAMLHCNKNNLSLSLSTKHKSTHKDI